MTSLVNLTDTLQIIVSLPSTKDSKEPFPLIIEVHGGPNSCVTEDFSTSAALYSLAGFALAQPNYTGSIGFGEEAIKRLEGSIGVLDVEDIKV